MKAYRFILCITLVSWTASLTGCTEHDPVLMEPEIGQPTAAVFSGGGPTWIPIRGSQTFMPAADAVPVDCGYGVYMASRTIAIGTVSNLGWARSVIEAATCELDPMTGIVSLEGTASQRAANGDEIFSTWTGAAAAGILTLDVEVTGGTGRFMQAEGALQAEGTIDPGTGVGEYWIEGFISYKASDRAQR